MRLRPPDRVIGDRYMERWHLIPRNPLLNMYLHRFVGSDDDRACHDHPWPSVSFLLKGKMREIIQHHWEPGRILRSWRYTKRFFPVFRSAKHAHRLELLSDEAWTIFITGPAIRRWGFWCGDRWVYWKDFTDATGNGIGRGCD